MIHNSNGISISLPHQGHWVPMCALIALGYVTRDDKNLAILLLVLAIGINAATYLGFQVRSLFLIRVTTSTADSNPRFNTYISRSITLTSLQIMLAH